MPQAMKQGEGPWFAQTQLSFVILVADRLVQKSACFIHKAQDSMVKDVEDPEAERWSRQYPRFPGITKCIELLARPNVQGTWVDIICEELTIHAHESPNEIIDEILAAPDKSPRKHMLMHVIADARLPESTSFLVEQLQSTDERTRAIAVDGLRQLDTKAARKALWDAKLA